MSEVLPQYKLGFIGAFFSGKLVDISDPDNPTDQDLTNYTNLYVIFTKPDGTTTQKVGQLNTTDADDTNDMDIYYQTTSDDILLDQCGYWEFTVAARFSNGNYLVSPESFGFWVVA